MAIYPKLRFPALKNRPFFYTNFVETVDGKVTVTTDPKAYWPIGSLTDHNTMIELRTRADALIHGASTASGHPTLISLNKPDFLTSRLRHGKSKTLPYFVLSNHPETSISSVFANALDTPAFLVTTKAAAVPQKLEAVITIVRAGNTSVDLAQLAAYLYKAGYKHVLVEGGPHILGSFFRADLIDEVFVTMAPKIFGNTDHQTLTMVEGHLFDATRIKHLQLLAVKQHADELFLRYRIKH